MYEFCGGVSSTLINDSQHHLTLDFAASAQRKCFYPVTSSNHIDCSKVSSPDLEAFLLYASAGSGEVDWGDSTTSGTPTQILFPNSVTAEQEAYARGFVDALEELHRRQGVPAQSVIWTQSSSSCFNSSAATSCRTSDVSYQLQTSSSVPGCASSSASSPGSSVGGPSDAARVVDVDRRQRRTTTDDGVQTVPRLSCLTPPSSPDVDPADLARIGRKRERNRLAAQKCRNRKLEQIAVLESGCAVLRAENDTLARTAKQLAEDVAQLRRTLADHTAGPHCVMNNTSSSASPSL